MKAPKPVVRYNGLVKPCCMPNNVFRSESGEDMLVEVCKTCGAKHYTALFRLGALFKTS